MKFFREFNNKAISLGVMVSLVLSLLLCAVPTEKAEAAGGWEILVNNATNTVTVYQNGVPVRNMICSTGSGTPGGGTYTLGGKMRWHALFGGVYGQYVTRITGSILFHSVPYMRYGDPSSLEPGEFDRLGTAASMGCVRLMVRDAKWIYDNCPTGGCSVTFYSSGDPGPLGWPVSYKISGLPDNMPAWDPTDNSGGNPWYTSQYFNSRVFDAGFYAGNNPDLAAAFGNDDIHLRSHWVRNGIPEGRRASYGFSLSIYKDNYADLRAAFGGDNYAYIRHYLSNGIYEGRFADYRIGSEVNADGSIIAGAGGTMYRLYNPNSGEHFYTASLGEANNLKNVGWRYEGHAWRAPTSGTPVYRVYNPNAGDHHYTTSAAERDHLVSVGWRYEGIGWYSGGSRPLYRLYNPNANTGTHHYTTSPVERDNVIRAGWNYEGIGWYGN